MEEMLKELKEYFKIQKYDKDNQLAFAIGYLKDCNKVNKKQAIEIIEKIFFGEI